jgi:hypothetical protein
VQVLLTEACSGDTRAAADAAAARWRTAHSECVTLRAQAAGPGAALDAGLAAVRDAEFVALFADGTVPASDFLEHSVAMFFDTASKPRPHLGWVVPSVIALDSAALPLPLAASLGFDDPAGGAGAATAHAAGMIPVRCGAAVWRVSALQRSGGLSSASCAEAEDAPWRAWLAGWHGAFARNAVAQAPLPARFPVHSARLLRSSHAAVQRARAYCMSLLAPEPGSAAHACSGRVRATVAYTLLRDATLALAWPAWALAAPLLVRFRLWLGHGPRIALAVYVLPLLLAAAAEALHASRGAVAAANDRLAPPGAPRVRRALRALPAALIRAGTLPVRTAGALMGLTAPLRPPTEGDEGDADLRAAKPRPRRLRYMLLVEALFVLYLALWAMQFRRHPHRRGYRIALPLALLEAACAVCAAAARHGIFRVLSGTGGTADGGGAGAEGQALLGAQDRGIRYGGTSALRINVAVISHSDDLSAADAFAIRP